MALSILDGTQTATTLSTILSSGQHITAHTVVSLGTQAITDMRGAVSGSVVSISNLPSTQTIAGTVTASNVINGFDSYNAVTGNLVVGTGYNGGLRITGINPVNGDPENLEEGGGIPIFSVGNINLPISGTVTANSSNGSLTTRFGSVATANTAFSTTAVTNTSRKYLMIQNITSTAITAGIGFTPTTTQGIQIVAGATITFDGSYIPTGAVRILSSVTASNFTVLEA